MTAAKTTQKTAPPGVGNRGKGRPKGSKNKTCVSRDVREMALNALNRKGGEEYLMRQADENPKAFMALLSRLIPTKVEGDAENPVRVLHTIKRVIINGDGERRIDD